jgi:hypothetical protein
VDIYRLAVEGKDPQTTLRCEKAAEDRRAGRFYAFLLPAENSSDSVPASRAVPDVIRLPIVDFSATTAVF